MVADLAWGLTEEGKRQYADLLQSTRIDVSEYALAREMIGEIVQRFPYLTVNGVPLVEVLERAAKDLESIPMSLLPDGYGSRNAAAVLRALAGTEER